MAHAHELVLIGSLLLLGGILAGTLSTRLGAPLLLAFLGLGMLAGRDGLGIQLHDRATTYLIGSVALALILFDGGLHTRRRVFRLGLAPASALATVGVLVTAAVVGLAAMVFLHVDWARGGLIGAIVASTDAAAVLLLLHQGGRGISERIAATLETEAGFNDPVAVFLTVTLVAVLGGGTERSLVEIGVFLLRQAALGLAIGVVGGYALVQLVNRLPVSAGLYPILIMAGALAIFAGTQLLDGSGYLAVYLAGLVCGNAHLRSSQTIARFNEAMAWLAQLVLFIMLGLMVAWRQLLPVLPAGLAVAAALMFVARPLAVWLCLTPFRFSTRERLFVAWVGLRGAVPIFLAMIPQFANLPHSDTYFHVAFIVVLASLVLQGWTIAPAARWLKLELPGEPAHAQRLDLDIAAESAREIAAWRVAAKSPAVERPFEELHLPAAARIIAVLREGVAVDREQIDRLRPGDVVMALAPDDTIDAADRLFAARRDDDTLDLALGDFPLAADVPMSTVVDLYGLPGTLADRTLTVGDFVRQRLRRAPVVGDRVHLGLIDLIVRRLDADRVTELGVILEPDRVPFEGVPLVWRMTRPGASLLRRMRRLGQKRL